MMFVGFASPTRKLATHNYSQFEDICEQDETDTCVCFISKLLGTRQKKDAAVSWGVVHWLLSVFILFHRKPLSFKMEYFLRAKYIQSGMTEMYGGCSKNKTLDVD